MADNGRVHPECVNAGNPYHQCGVACLEKIAQGITRKSMSKKKSDSPRSVKQVQLIRKIDGERRVANPNCPKAANPYHECGKYCTNKPADANFHDTDKDEGPFLLGAPVSMIRKTKEALSQPNSPHGVNNNVSAAKAANVAAIASPRSPVSKTDSNANSNKKVVESDNSQSTSSSEEEIDSREQSFHETQAPTYESVPASGIIPPDGPLSPNKGSFTSFVDPKPTKQQHEEKNLTTSSPKGASSPKPGDANNDEPIMKTMEFSFSGISHVSHDSDDDEVQSVISDSCVSVGKYHVRATIASILSAIFAKYGDIAGNCKLESVSMRAYYLECLCSVVLELQSLSIRQLTKSKVKEMLAVLKDVESAGIDVHWLRDILNDLTEVVDLNSQHQAAELAKAECDHAVESVNRELESMMEDMALKEQAVAEARSKVEQTRARLLELEAESSKLSEAVSSTWSLVEKFHSKSLADDIL
ncbi:unnamed protein product [Linum tenue]|uniref:Phospholipase-like protein n=1 Tax=Linum tenue TaxID=586396 RepID=A0AAV0LXZ9_9ROSI|nr:unnamed protein product [Linum tenue]